MTLDELYAQCNMDSEDWFPHVSGDLAHHILGLCGEAGELANLAKKMQRGDANTKKLHDDMVDEATDVLIYIMNVFGNLGFHPEAAYVRKREFNRRRFGGPRNAVNGRHNLPHRVPGAAL